MALEALSTNELFNLIIYDTFSATPALSHNEASETTNLAAVAPKQPGQDLCGGDGGGLDACSSMPAWRRRHSAGAEMITPHSRAQQNLAVQGGGRKKRRRRPKICKNKEEAETQRITHIAVERNRRKQMNEHLAVLRSLMPESYVQRGDQASIVGGAIEFVKELEHLLQSLEARKFQLLHGGGGEGGGGGATTTAAECGGAEFLPNPFSQFFSYPQYTCSPQLPNKYISKSKAAIADIEVTLIETHANIRILSIRRVRQLSKIVATFQSMCLSTLHLNVTTLDSLVLYSISAKVEEGCQLNSADEIAGAVHHMLRIIEEEDTLSTCQQAV
ncbi:PREDICTED: transcription factor bHLH71-like [Ipomoea nil]|uniref:transcription factor bHLH71-like n=1 Tax=Ipomoea nil TaxID=35883 RepID=UPI0009018FF3|nr:PREDICTED: transcription factor bHLH71-like [Ipomoea nil]